MESGDVTFVRSVAPKPIPLSLDYRCGKCGKRITDWSARIDPVTTKLVLTAKCHGLTSEMTIYLDLRGTLFTG
jgi:hypothetical protein